MLWTRTVAAVDGNYAPSPLKAARTILTATNQVKIASQPYKPLIILYFLQRRRARFRAVAAAKTPPPRQANRVAFLGASHGFLCPLQQNSFLPPWPTQPAPPASSSV